MCAALGHGEVGDHRAERGQRQHDARGAAEADERSIADAATITPHAPTIARIDDLAYLSIAEAADALRTRRTSSVELVRACLDRAEARRGLGAFITLTAESALAEAREADERLARGIDRGPLHGVPVAVKDLFDVRGVRTTGGSKILERHTAAADSGAVERLRAAGAVVVGKTNLHEWAFGVTTQNPHYGPAKNPWDTTRVPGGSSGGSAVAVASGMCAMGLGSDTGGSIRIPAALCGVVGLKPTYGRVSLRGAIALAWTLDHAGPLTRTVRDAALSLAALAGYDDADPASADRDVDDYLAGLGEGVSGLRVLVPTTFFFDDVDPAVEAAVRAAARLLASLGARCVEAALPHIDIVRETQRRIIGVEAAAFHADTLARADVEQVVGRDVLERLRAGARVTGTEHAAARRQREVIRRAWEHVLRDHDLILTPATPIPAPPRQGEDAVAVAARLNALTSPFNLTGLPAISVPCGYTTEGLPIGLQLAAAPWREATLLRTAYAYERAPEWHERRPG